MRTLFAIAITLLLIIGNYLISVEVYSRSLIAHSNRNGATEESKMQFNSLGCNVRVRSGAVFPGEINYVVSSSSPDEKGECDDKEHNSGIIQVFRAGAPALTIRPPENLNSNIKLVDVVDMDGDGAAEIVAVNDNTNGDDEKSGAFFIYNAANGNQPLITLTGKQEELANELYRSESLNADSVKIYRLKNGRNAVVVAGGVAGTTFDATIHFYQLNSQGLIVDNPFTIPAPCHETICNDALSYPMIAVDDLDNDGFKEVVILAKAKLLLFKGEGAQESDTGKFLYVSQFVDPNAGSFNFDVFKDYGGKNGPVGYRYGHMEIVRDLDNDGIKDLIVAADAIPIRYYQSGDYPRMIVQAFKLSPPDKPNSGYLRPLGPLTSPQTSPSFTGITVAGANRPSDSQPGEPPVGCTVDSIRDINNDSWPEVIVSGRNQGKNFVDVYSFDLKDGWRRIKRFKGICLDIISLDNASTTQPQPPDIIIWNKQTSSLDIWRWDLSAKNFSRIGAIPATRTPSLADSSNFALNNRYGAYEQHGSNSNFHRLIVTTQSGEQQFIQDEKTQTAACGSLKSWNTNNRQLNLRLNIAVLPGRISFIDQSIFAINNFIDCQASGVIELYQQQDDQLFSLGNR